MKKSNVQCLIVLLALILFSPDIFAQQASNSQTESTPSKFALVIGNGGYSNLNHLTNPPNDAYDVAAALESLGFTVDKLIDGSLDQMDNAVIRLKNRLSVSKNTYGFFFYAGHGVQSGGENYLIPVDANIPGESFLRNRALSVQSMLDELNNAGNSLNVVVLDACRDNPFSWSWSRSGSGSRGLAVLDYQPADSIIVYATSAGRTASDGLGRNGLFTSQLLPNLTAPGLEVAEVFKRTGADVADASKRQQIPAVYNQFFGTAYLGSRPPSVYEAGEATVATGSLRIATVTAGTIQIIGEDVNQSAGLPAWGSIPIDKINAGTYRVVMTYGDGKTEEKTVEVGREETATLDFNYRPAPLPSPAPVRSKREIAPEAARLNTIGAAIGSSFSAPWFIGTIEGTYAPWRFSFFDLGVDGGLISGEKDVTHYSLYPFAHYAFFWPFTGSIGWYAGAGGGLMMASYTFPEGTVTRNIWAADAATGFIFGFGLTVSYSLRTDFSTANNKFAVGYCNFA